MTGPGGAVASLAAARLAGGGPVEDRLEAAGRLLRGLEAELAALTQVRNALVAEARSGDRPMTLRAIAGRLGVSEVQVHRIAQRASAGVPS